MFLSGFCLTKHTACAGREVKLKVVQTSDIHGNYYPYDFTPPGGNRQSGTCACFGAKERGAYGENLILLDNGDILQGQPTAYYYNYIDTVAPHLAAEMMNSWGIMPAIWVTMT